MLVEILYVSMGLIAIRFSLNKFQISMTDTVTRCGKIMKEIVAIRIGMEQETQYTVSYCKATFPYNFLFRFGHADSTFTCRRLANATHSESIRFHLINNEKTQFSATIIYTHPDTTINVVTTINRKSRILHSDA